MEEHNGSSFFSTIFRRQDHVGCRKFGVVAKKTYYQLRKQNAWLTQRSKNLVAN